MKLKIVFAGTPAFALPCLEALFKSNHELCAIYTQPDRPDGRGRLLQASPVKIWAKQHTIPIYQPINFKEQANIDELNALKPDVMVVIAYGLILPRAVLDIPRFGCINVHASMLPRWRGASPIQHAILAGDVETGITIMQLDVGMDTGDMLSQAPCLINNSTAEELHDRLAKLAVLPLLETLDDLEIKQKKSIKQDHLLASYAPKINKEDAVIDWHQPAVSIERQIRAFNPWPIAYTQMGNTTLRIHQATLVTDATTAPPGTIIAIEKKGMLVVTGKQSLLVERIQFPGGKILSVADWINSGQHKPYLHCQLT